MKLIHEKAVFICCAEQGEHEDVNGGVVGQEEQVQGRSHSELAEHGELLMDRGILFNVFNGHD